MTKPIVLLDTNVYLSAIIFGGLPQKVLALAINDKIVLYTSAAILLETAVKLTDKFNWLEEEVAEVIKAIGEIAVVVKPKRSLNVVKADPNDNKILEAAIEARVTWIITGDKHLLDLKQHWGIRIITPAQFLKEYMEKTSA